MPTIEVRFEHLNVEAEAYVGGRALPTMFNFSINMLEVVNSTPRHSIQFSFVVFNFYKN